MGIAKEISMDANAAGYRLAAAGKHSNAGCEGGLQFEA